MNALWKAKPFHAMLRAGALAIAAVSLAIADDEALTYRHFRVIDKDDKVAAIEPIPDEKTPLWARDVSQEPYDWSGGPDMSKPYFKGPIPFVIPPEEGSGEPFYGHNHQPAITWCENGDLSAIWYSTKGESDLILTVLASRLRPGNEAWGPSSEFFKVPNRNMHGSGLFHDGKGKLYHFNGMSPDHGRGWSKLALLLRTSTDNGVTWTTARTISSGANYQKRHQVIAGALMTRDGTLIQACDATPGGEGPTAIHISRDGGKTWTDPGGDIRGIHAGVVELKDRRLMAFGRAQAIDGKMPISISDDMGKSWAYTASPFPPISSGQRLVLRRLNEGPLLLVSFNSTRGGKGEMTFTDKDGKEYTGPGMFAALSFDEGATWPVRRLLTQTERGGYLASTQTPDDMIHLISSRLYYRFNLAWMTAQTVSRHDKKGRVHL